eukprot:TRINITY_DN2506_c0_g1_i1.p1 TRINITY_DN2506_c0_g1~~TRINITY_DN2506_c0_g1_i1.p1  ORF type:complete len:146 (+),score=25.85 TRINITY_DN2506_c0_g1_i1:120-557(+)
MTDATVVVGFEASFNFTTRFSVTANIQVNGGDWGEKTIVNYSPKKDSFEVCGNSPDGCSVCANFINWSFSGPSFAKYFNVCGHLSTLTSTCGATKETCTIPAPSSSPVLTGGEQDISLGLPRKYAFGPSYPPKFPWVNGGLYCDE